MQIFSGCINSFEHSGSPSGNVRLRYLLPPEQIELFVQDDGKGFRPSKEDDDAKRHRGWGLKLISELVDDVDITTGEHGTTVRMGKNLRAGHGEGTITAKNEG